MIDKVPFELGKPYRFGGRQTIYPIKYEIRSDSNRIHITGYYEYQYREYMKFHTLIASGVIGPVSVPQTVAEYEGIEKMPEPVTIRINRNCTIKAVA